MRMDLPGKKATHDFLLLQNKDSRPSNSRGFNLRTYDFLQPLERGGGGEETERRKEGEAAAGTAEAHVLPGGIGTFSISHVSESGSTTVVKTEGGTCGEGGGYRTYAAAGVAFASWDQAGSSPTENGSRGPWPSPPVAARSSLKSLSSSRHPQPQSRKRSMERSSGFDDDDDDEEFGGRRDTSLYRGEFGVRVDGKNSGADQRPSTPRSKHSATEQRRRSKINDRFQILRELIPHSDQKRDKASFLLEVIEYIRFLQEKAQKYESSYPGWTEEDAKLMPWVKVYFRQFWKNARNNQGSGDGIADPSQVMKNGSVPTEFIFPGNDNIAPVVPTMLSAALHPSEPDMSSNVADKAAEDSVAFASKVPVACVSQPNLCASIGRATSIGQSQQLISDVHNMTSQSQLQWLRSPCPTDYAVNGDVLSEHEELAIDEGTISVSSAYSEGLLTALSQTLQSSGLDLSQASISVNINLGKRATNGRPTTTTTMSSAKGNGEPSSGNGMVGRPKVGSNGEDSEQPCKRQKSDYS